MLQRRGAGNLVLSSRHDRARVDLANNRGDFERMLRAYRSSVGVRGKVHDTFVPPAEKRRLKAYRAQQRRRKQLLNERRRSG